VFTVRLHSLQKDCKAPTQCCKPDGVSEIKNLSEKARKAYFSLKSKISYSNFISVEKWIKLFDSLITPMMTYGLEI
jgi:hypothetical protein